MRVKDLMHVSRSLTPADTVLAVARHMRDYHVDCVAVTRGPEPVGIITARDIVVRCTAFGHDPARCLVADHVTTPVVCLSPDADAAEALETMRQHRVRHLPVMEGIRYAGMVSWIDLAEALLPSMRDLLAMADTTSRDVAPAPPNG